MKKIICFFHIIIISCLSNFTISCNNNLNTTIDELNNNVSDLIFKNVNLTFNISINDNGQQISFFNWNNLQYNLNNFINNIYVPNTKKMKSEYQNFFSKLGYKNVNSTDDLLKYLNIDIDKNIGIGNLGFVFSGLSIDQNYYKNNIKITLNNIRLYFIFSDPINGIYKEFYFTNSDNIAPNFSNASIYYPIPTNNLNNETYEEWNIYHNTDEYINEKLQLIYLKLWFEEPYFNNIENLLVSGTSLLLISKTIKLYDNNIFNFLTTALFGKTEISSIVLKRNNTTISNFSDQKLELNDNLIFNIKFNFLDYDKNFIIQFKILR